MRLVLLSAYLINWNKFLISVVPFITFYALYKG